MVFILFIITAILSGYIDGQNTYMRNDFVCKKWVCSVIQYQLQIVGNVSTLTYNIKSNVSVSECFYQEEFHLGKINDSIYLLRGTVDCRVKAIPLDSFFTSNVSSTVDVTCESTTICSRYRYDRIGSSVTSTRIGSCNVNSCIACPSRGPWQLNLTSMMLERTIENCDGIFHMSIVDFFILDSPITSSTVTTTEAKDSPITSSTVSTTETKDSPITSSTVTTKAKGYIDGQNTYVRNDLVCKKWVCSVFQYQLQIVDNVYNLTNNNIKSNEIVSDCYNLNEFQLKKVNDAYNLMRFQYACRIIAISLDSFFTSNVSSTVDITCESRTNCSRYRYDRIGSSVASTRIGPCTYNSCTKCAFRGPWQLKLTSMMLERTMDTGYCEAIEEMSIADYFILDSPISSSTVTTTEAKDSPITSSTVTTKAKDSPITSSTVTTTTAKDSPITSSTVTTKAKDSPITSSTVTTTTAKDSPITSSTVTATTAKDSPITSSTVTTKAKDSPITSSTVTTKAKDSPITSSTVTATTAKDSTSKKSQSTLIWSFGTITVNLISCLLINGLK